MRPDLLFSSKFNSKIDAYYKRKVFFFFSVFDFMLC